MTRPDRAVKLRHSLTPADVELIVEALEVDGLEIVTIDWSELPREASIERITAALCGGTEQDYE